MKKKKLIALGLGAMMMSMAVLPVSADDMNVTYRQKNDYTLSIPSSIDLNTATATAVSVSNVNLEPNANIKIQISGGMETNGNIELSRKDDTPTKAITTVKTTQDGNAILPSVDFVTFTEDGTQALYFTDLTAKAGGAIKAGNYSTTLTFTVSAPEKN